MSPTCRLLLSATLALLAAGCDRQGGESASPVATPAATAADAARVKASDESAVRAVVERFGGQMKKVSTLAPAEAARPQLREVYGGLLTPALLQAWLDDPSQAVGREVSSPWPEGIDIDNIDCQVAEGCRAQGEVRYITSNEREHGGVAARRKIRLHVEKNDGRAWRIGAVELEAVER